MSEDNAVLALQREFNERTRESWASYGGHRRKVTDLLLAARTFSPARLCVLGAGNCNDLDLSQLTAAYNEICLVDLDEPAIRAGVARQAPTAGERIDIVPALDVSGAAPLMARWSPESPASDESVDECLSANARPIECEEFDGEAAFDVVASTCLLTQLIESVRVTLGESHPRFLELVTSLRKRHWRFMSRRARPGGLLLLITDFVSSDTAPDLVVESQERLDHLAMRLIAARNFFTGANPLALRQELLSDPELIPLVGRVELLAPWRWRIESRVYLVCAIRAEARNHRESAT